MSLFSCRSDNERVEEEQQQITRHVRFVLIHPFNWFSVERVFFLLLVQSKMIERANPCAYIMFVSSSQSMKCTVTSTKWRNILFKRINMIAWRFFLLFSFSFQMGIRTRLACRWDRQNKTLRHVKNGILNDFDNERGSVWHHRTTESEREEER